MTAVTVHEGNWEVLYCMCSHVLSFCTLESSSCAEEMCAVANYPYRAAAAPYRAAVRPTFWTGVHRSQAQSCLLQALTVLLLHAGPDQLFVRVHDAVRHCEEMCNSSSGIMNGFHYTEDGHDAPLSSAAEPMLPRRSIDCV